MTIYSNHNFCNKYWIGRLQICRQHINNDNNKRLISPTPQSWHRESPLPLCEQEELLPTERIISGWFCQKMDGEQIS